MTKEQFIERWWPACTTTFIDDLEAVIAHEIAKAQEAKLKHADQVTDQPAPKYPIGGYAPGHYTRICSNCKIKFMGDKRAIQCEPCAVKTTRQPTEQPAPEMCESDAIDYILTNKLNWKKLGNNRMFAIGFARTGASFRVSFVEYHRMLSGTREVIIHNIDLSEWQPVDTSIKQPEIPFNKERFEAMFRAVVERGSNTDIEWSINVAENAITQLDAYYAEKEKGGSNG